MTTPLHDPQGQDREAGGLSPADLEAAWQEALAEMSRGTGWDDDHLWALGPGPGYDDAPDADQVGGDL